MLFRAAAERDTLDLRHSQTVPGNADTPPGLFVDSGRHEELCSQCFS